VPQLYAEISEKISEKFPSLFEAFMAAAKGDVLLSGFGLPKQVADKLSDAVLQRIKPPVVEVKGKLTLATYDADGVSVVRQALELAVKQGIEASYLGAGTYLLKFTAENYKSAEQVMGKASSAAVSFIESKGGEGQFVRV